MFKTLSLAHNLRASRYLETLLTSAAVTVVSIRVFLNLSGYPQLGGNQTLHIAHMLWGGFIMLGVILFLLSFFGRYIHMLSAIMGGIGFGIFIDELGKFITTNNDYFFQPAIPVMYFIFILLFFLGRHLLAVRQPSSNDYLINSLAMLQDSLLGKKDREYYEHIEYLLKKTGRRNPFAKQLQQYVQLQLVLLPDVVAKHSFSRTIEGWYQALLKRRVVDLLSVVFFGFYTLYSSVTIIKALFDANTLSLANLSLLEKLKCLTVVIIVFITLGGLIELTFSRLHAYKTLELAVYLSLYLLQVFIFYSNQLDGIFGLSITLLTLFVLKSLIRAEEHQIHMNILGRMNDKI